MSWGPDWEDGLLRLFRAGEMKPFILGQWFRREAVALRQAKFLMSTLAVRVKRVNL